MREHEAYIEPTGMFLVMMNCSCGHYFGEFRLPTLYDLDLAFDEHIPCHEGEATGLHALYHHNR